MKKLSELGISPWPWSARKVSREEGFGGFEVYDDNGNYVLFDGDAGCANCNLMSAVPYLYEALREAVIDKCTKCHEVNDYESNIEIEWQMCRDCPARKWRDALAKAAGESETDND